MDPAELLRRTLLLDLEVTLEGRIREVGAVLGAESMRPTPSEAAEVLAGLSSRARWVAGHNLVEHDLVRWREKHPGHPLLELPVIDTLVLSPLCFPENPYHRLVKDYKLVRESKSDPVADARQAGLLLQDEIQALDGMRRADPALFRMLHFLLATHRSSDGLHGERHAAGMELLFSTLGGTRMSDEDMLATCRDWIRPWACRSVVPDAGWIGTALDRLALAFVLSWLRVSGANSVLPPWVRMQHPGTSRRIRELREVPCGDPACTWCKSVHDPRDWLKRLFGHDDFRSTPANATGGSLQRDIVVAGLRDESMLAILPTGGGKSICYQIPALARNMRRGVLTVVISPLQALMKDQVDGLVRRTGSTGVAALYGLLTPPERGDVLHRIRMGDIALLYVSPEQLRNRSFRSAISQREIGCWVFDEAHCLSKWGHDFRPDYLYAGRFIREFTQASGGPLPAVACFTATAKREVRDEILAHFRAETGRELRLFEGGVERDNLEFAVQPVPVHAKLERLHDLLSDRLGIGRSGSAIVFHAKRESAEIAAEYLRNKGWAAKHFHAGLLPPEKKRVQDEFLGGSLRVICATNAFGMGIDKDDVRLVVHADTPGSLENYLQEAGRAGRDGDRAECVLLFDEADCEAQFRMGAMSQITRNDIAQILRGLRKRAARLEDGEVVVTTGELLRDEDVETGITLEDRSADTKVRTAVAWLERAGFIERNENVTQVFQATPLVRDLDDARARIERLNLSATDQKLWLAILRELLATQVDENLTVDDLAMLPEFQSVFARENGHAGSPERTSARVLKILGSMAQSGLLKRDLLLSAFVRHQVVESSRSRLERVGKVERAMLDMLALEAPDPEGWMALSPRLVNQRLVDQGLESSVEMVRQLLASLRDDGRGMGGSHGSIDLRDAGQDHYRIRRRRSWKLIEELADKRRRVAGTALGVILGKIPADAGPSAELLVPFGFDDVARAIDQDLLLRSEVKDVQAAVERGLLFMHEHHVVQLQQGLAVFRSAMTIRVQPRRRKDRYLVADYQPLKDHYQERILQVHVMGEYARRGMEMIGKARALVLAYFSLEKTSFVRRFLSARPDLLARATTARSFERIVTELGNRAQIRIVTAPTDRNLLVLAGPGSGKTRAVVHRCAYLLRVERVPPRSILVCCFNRAAAVELRRRLVDLVGPDARGVTIQTYHGLALRLLGRSVSALAEKPGTSDVDLAALIPEAVKLLEGEIVPPGVEPDELRDRLLAGFRHILVDEYQDIDAPQYEMISAIAGRTLEDPEQKLSILAVGDDDQNIYSFRGANVEFIRRFQQDYRAEVHHLVENYRATRHLVEASNRLISLNRDRMKVEHPIRVDANRELHPPGGEFGERDPIARGQVQILRPHAPGDGPDVVVDELRRLAQLGSTSWSSMAVLSSTHRDLAPIRTAAEAAAIPVRWHASRHAWPSLHRIREIALLLDALGRAPSATPGAAADALAGPAIRASTIGQWIASTFRNETANPWVRFLERQVEAWRLDSDDAELPVAAAREYLYEACADRRRDFDLGDGVLLTTVHAAKGTEFDHVLLVGHWPHRPNPAEAEEQRRIFYVGMTRARKTLAILDQGTRDDGITISLEGSGVLVRDVPSCTASRGTPAGRPLASTEYSVLGLEDVHLGFPAFFPEGHPVHRALARLRPGSPLRMARPPTSASDEPSLALFDPDGNIVARLSRKGESEWAHRLVDIQEIRVLAMIRRDAGQDADVARRATYRIDRWEVPLVEIVSRAR